MQSHENVATSSTRRYSSRGSAVSVLFCTDPATTKIYTLSLHDALPISHLHLLGRSRCERSQSRLDGRRETRLRSRSEEHTSELQSRGHLVCRLLLEKKKTQPIERQKGLLHAFRVAAVLAASVCSFLNSV